MPRLVFRIYGDTTPHLMSGKRRTVAGYQKVGVTLPDGLYEEMIRVIDNERRWVDRVEFIREAIKEKLERWKKEHPLGLPTP